MYLNLINYFYCLRYLFGTKVPKLNPLVPKEIVFILDKNTFFSERATLIPAELEKIGWKIAFLNSRESTQIGFQKNSFRTNYELLYILQKYHSNKLIYYLSATDYQLANSIIRHFNERLILDYVDIFANNITPSWKSFVGKRLAKLQYSSVVRGKNFIFRDLQIRSINRSVLKDKNIIFFGNYIPRKTQQIKNKNSTDKIKIVSIGNIQTNDFGNGLALEDFYERLDKDKFELHIYKHPFINLNGYFKQERENLFTHDFVSPDRIASEISKYDYGIHIVGDHYFSEYDQGGWRKSLYFNNLGARVSTYLAAGLGLIINMTRPINFTQFYCQRYANNVYDAHEFLNNPLIKKSETQLPRSEKIYIDSNILRLEKFLNKISSNFEV